MARPTELIVNPCTPGDNAHNAQVTQELITNIITLIEESGTVDDKKLAVNGTDFTNATYDYLHAKVEQTDVADATLGYATVHSQTVGDLTELFYVDLSLVSGYDGTLKVLSIDGGELFWLTASGLVDSYEVMVTADDSTPKFLHSAFNLNTSYVSGADMLVGTQTVGSAATNQTERLFVDVSAITGYDASAFRVLTLEANAVAWRSPTDAVADLLGEGYAIDIATNQIGFDPTELSGFTGAFQFFHHLSAASAATDPAWKTVADYDASKTQMWWHQSGTFEFMTTEDYSASKMQLLANFNDTWKWRETKDYSGTAFQFLIHEDDAEAQKRWKWQTATGYDAAEKQLLYNDAGTWKWVAPCTILAEFLTVELNLTSTKLTVVLKCDGSTISSDEVDVGACP